MYGKYLAIVTATVVGAAGFASVGFAAPTPIGPVVSLQFGGNGSGIDKPFNNPVGQDPTATAGIVSGATHFNYEVDAPQDNQGSHVSTLSYAGSYPGSGAFNTTLVNSDGNDSGVSFAYNYSRASDTGGVGAGKPYDQFASGSTNGALMAESVGVQGLGNATLALAGLPTSGNYDIIAYVTPYFFGGGGVEEVGLGSTIYYLHSGAYSSFIQSSATDAATATANGVSNYVEFDNLSGSTQTLTVYDNGTSFGLDAIQIVPVSGSTVPEPASLSLLAVGGLITLRRRRR